MWFTSQLWMKIWLLNVFFTPKIHLGFRTTIGKSRKGGNVLNHNHAKQCHYCNNYFIKSDEKMKKHLSICSGKAGLTFSFDNGKIADHQDHYRNLGNLSFSIYYDFETSTGSVVFFDAKMYLVSYAWLWLFIQILRFGDYWYFEVAIKIKMRLLHFRTFKL